MQKKYEFTGETQKFNGRTLHRIRRLSDGAIGGWIEKEANLSHEDECWVYGEARVYGGARVYGEARVCGWARVWGEARVFDRAQVYGWAAVYGEAQVSCEAEVFGQARVYDRAFVFGEAMVSGEADVSGWARVYDRARVYGEAQVNGEAWVCDRAQVSGKAKITNPKDIKCFSGFEFKVTITPQNATIGCQTKTHEEWLAITKEEAIKLGFPENEYDYLKELLIINFKHIKKEN